VDSAEFENLESSFELAMLRSENATLRAELATERERADVSARESAGLRQDLRRARNAVRSMVEEFETTGEDR
jgi:hypothetical protein